MTDRNKKTIWEALKTVSPIITGMIPTAIAYAIICKEAGIKDLHIILSSLIVFAGTIQFISIELIKENMKYLQFALVIFLVHSRHMFYGLSLFEKFKRTGMAKVFMIFSLTDEAYAVYTGTSVKDGLNEGLYYFTVAFSCYLAWNFGTAFGVFASSFITFNTAGVDFALTAMFIVILTGHVKRSENKTPFVIGGVSALLSLIVLGAESMLLGASVLSVILLFLAKKSIVQSEDKQTEGESNE